MSGSNDKSSELDRSASLRTSLRLSHVQSNVQGDDDDYDLAAMGISDGFRPVEVAQNHNSSHIPRPSVSSLEPPAALFAPPRPSSISKPHRPHESLSLRNEGPPMDPVDETVPTRASSVSTTSPFVNSEIPYEGPSGPSHPYQMYPQDVRLARTASLATTSTAPVSERSYNGPRGPTHPYGMYPQNTVPESEAGTSRPAQREIHVGFPGANDNYQRRIGPDGEDAADLIGPDGHTEQLPPYTRYPDEAYNRKALGIDTPQAAPVQLTPVQPTLAIPGAGGIGLATRDPEFASTEDLHGANSPESRRSVRSFTSDATSHEGINMAAAAVITDEKKPLKNWQVAAKRKVWGIVPCWALTLAVFVLIMMGVVLGTVIGTLLGHHSDHKGPHADRPPQPAVTTITYDATPLSTVPPGLPDLAEGTYAMPLMNTRMSNTCFNDTTQAQAWNCNFVFSQLSMVVEKLRNVPDTLAYSMNFTYNDTYTIQRYIYSYGVQPPDLTDLQLKLVNDSYESATRGPAWAFEIPYNKTIILPEEFLTPASSTNKKLRRMDFSGDFSGDFKRKGIAQVGDKPWICHWNSTVLETFIYASQNSSYSRPVGLDGSDSASATATPSSDNAASVPAASAASPTSAAETTSVERRDAQREEFGEHSPLFSDSDVEYGNQYLSSFGTTSSPTTYVESVTVTTTAAPSSSATDYFSNNPMPPNKDPPYPRVVKMEERRIPGYATTMPWCRQFEVIADGVEARPVLDASGNFIDVEIVEEDSKYETPTSKRAVADPFLTNRDSDNSGNDMTDCGCMWWLT
ncbi:Uu.00g127000.m01.CDS01 [Anthostomella pinea]|uniref:Uu.00g127000.m01.CDS01 n=1 Tax=Anthostomella pinea TaxID=933095 RepID=A0AAI8VIR9_9PEZI|nr:Uu.00g127000.m01.CDS01 [Anthostomella pinea]